MPRRTWQRNRDLSLRAFLLGEPGSGKTTRVAEWVRKLDGWTYFGVPWVDSIFVFDRLREPHWEKWAIARGLGDFWELCAEHEDEEGDLVRELPSCVVWRCGVEPENYAPALRLAVDQGNVLLVFSECADWFPNQKGSWPVQQIRDDGVMLEHILRAGRHISDINGALCPIHFIADTQYAMDVSPLLRNTANFIATGPIEGSNNLDWVRRNMGRDGRALADEISQLEKHQWVTLRDKQHDALPAFPLKVQP